MNRVIKFRGKRLDNGEWVYGFLVPLKDDTIIIEEPGVYNDGSASPFFFCNWNFVDKNTIDQFTGLHDRNGKEIYNGDILVSEGVVVDYLEVFWSDDKAAFIVEDYDCDKQTTLNCEYLSCYDTAYYTICGNTHDNPRPAKRRIT